ncbi:hypothetical protein KM043_000498 [Ampulex compressa]|nr:hypothetical protein KM043_000498 [Ampulex compressa]
MGSYPNSDSQASQLRSRANLNFPSKRCFGEKESLVRRSSRGSTSSSGADGSILRDRPCRRRWHRVERDRLGGAKREKDGEALHFARPKTLCEDCRRTIRRSIHRERRSLSDEESVRSDERASAHRSSTRSKERARGELRASRRGSSLEGSKWPEDHRGGGWSGCVRVRFGRSDGANVDGSSESTAASLSTELTRSSDGPADEPRPAARSGDPFGGLGARGATSARLFPSSPSSSVSGSSGERARAAWARPGPDTEESARGRWREALWKGEARSRRRGDPAAGRKGGGFAFAKRRGRSSLYGDSE